MHHLSIVESVTALRRRRAADGAIFASITISAMLIEAAMRRNPDDSVLLRLVSQYYTSDQCVWERLGTLAHSLLHTNLADIVLSTIEQLRQDAGLLLKDAANADSVATWANCLYRAAPMSAAAAALAELAGSTESSAVRIRFRNAHRAEDERSTVIGSALTTTPSTCLMGLLASSYNDASPWSMQNVALKQPVNSFSLSLSTENTDIPSRRSKRCSGAFESMTAEPRRVGWLRLPAGRTPSRVTSRDPARSSRTGVAMALPGARNDARAAT